MKPFGAKDLRRTRKASAVRLARDRRRGLARSRPSVELLEVRALLAVGITEFPLPQAAGFPTGAIVAGPVGGLWFTESVGGTSSIGRISTDGTVTEFPIPSLGYPPAGIAAGSDGNLWFTEPDGAQSQIGRITPQGSITFFSIPGAGFETAPRSIANGPDGNLWFTDTNDDAIGRITPQGRVTEFPLPSVTNAQLGAITTGPDGNLWFTEPYGTDIGRITPQGTITLFPFASGTHEVQSIVTGPDGNLWFTDQEGDGIGAIGQITPEGAITEFPVSTTPYQSRPFGITSGPDGALWFTDPATETIGRITTGGTITTIDVPRVPSDPSSIVTGPDGDLYFTDSLAQGSAVGKLSLAVANASLSVVGVPVSASDIAPFSGIVARFSDANSGDVASDYEARIDWGDGLFSAGTVVADGTGFAVTGEHGYFAPGSYTVTVTVSDLRAAQGNPGPFVSATATASVAGTPITANGSAVSAYAGVEFNVAVASGPFSAETPYSNSVYPEYGNAIYDPTHPNLTATIDWGDGTTSAGTVNNGIQVINFTANSTQGAATSSSSQTSVVFGDHTYAKPGTYTIHVAIQDKSGESTTTTSTATVTQGVPTAQSYPISVSEGSEVTGPLATGPITEPLTDLSATIDWGDGSPTTAGTIAPEPTLLFPPPILTGFTPQIVVVGNGPATQFMVTGSHVYQASGNYTAKVTIRDTNGNQTVVDVSVTVTAVPLLVNDPASISATEGSPVQGAVVSFHDANDTAQPSDFSVTIDWGDGATTSGNVVATGNGNFDVDAPAAPNAHAYSHEGTYAFLVSISASDGASGFAFGDATVADAPLEVSTVPVATAAGAPFSGQVGTLVDLGGLEAPSAYQVTINWGDGTTSAGTIAEPKAGALIDGSHVYAAAGSYPIQVTAKDVGGSTASASGTANVVTLNGMLNPASDSGPSHTDGITNVKKPIFDGSAPAGTHVTLFAFASGQTTPVMVASTTATAQGTWQITSQALADGSYSMFVSSTAVDGTTVVVPIEPITIATVGPSVQSLDVNASQGSVQVNFSDPAALNSLNLGKSAFTVRGPGGRVATVTSVTLAGADAVVIGINGGSVLRPGTYALKLAPSIADLAGNRLHTVRKGKAAVESFYVFPHASSAVSSRSASGSLNANSGRQKRSHPR